MMENIQFSKLMLEKRDDNKGKVHPRKGHKAPDGESRHTVLLLL